MQLKLIRVCLATLLLPLAVQAEAPKHAKSLDQVSALIQNKGGSEQYAEQMNGAPKPDGFGTTLPSGFSAKEIAGLLAPREKASLATLIGVKAWPHRANTYIALACFAQTQKEYDSDKRYERGPSCTKYYNPAPGNSRVYIDKPVYLGVLEYKPGDPKPILIASYGKPLDVKTSWKESELVGPQGKFDTPGSDESDLMPEEYLKFDFAPYKITEGETAFGLRVGWNDSYAGGGGFFEALSLFKIEGSKLVNVLSEPIYFYQNIAGDWNKDGTRNHDLEEGQNVLSVLPGKSQGYFDLQMRTLKSKWKKVFKWDASRSRYIAVPAKPKTMPAGRS